MFSDVSLSLLPFYCCIWLSLLFSFLKNQYFSLFKLWFFLFVPHLSLFDEDVVYFLVLLDNPYLPLRCQYSANLISLLSFPLMLNTQEIALNLLDLFNFWPLPICPQVINPDIKLFFFMLLNGSFFFLPLHWTNLSFLITFLKN